MPHMARRVADFGTTIFSEINTLARDYGAVNLGQGAPDFDGPPEVLAAAHSALNSNQNQYAPGIGIAKVRAAIAGHAQRFYGQTVDPDTQVIVTSGATEAIFAAILGLCDPGDEAIVFAPFFDSYVPNMVMAGVTPRYVHLYAPDWTFDPAELAAAFTPRTRIILINTPNNPTGKVYSRDELTVIAELCQQYDVIAVMDEVYEHILYDGAVHTRMATIPGMADRTLTISSMGKTFSVTGWKVGWAIGSRELVSGLGRAHQFITFAVSSPLQAAVETALNLPNDYYERLRLTYQTRRDYLLNALTQVGFQVMKPQGGYFVITDWRQIAPPEIQDDLPFAKWMIATVGVAGIPLSAFYQPSDKHLGQRFARFAVCKRDSTLQAGVEKLQTWAETSAGKQIAAS